MTRGRTIEEGMARAGAIRTIEPRPMRRSGNRGWLCITNDATKAILGIGVEGTTEEEAVERFYKAREDWARMVEAPMAEPSEKAGHPHA